MENFPVQKQTVKQFLRFIIIGFINTGVDLVILNVEMALTDKTAGLAYAVQKGISFTFAVTMSYFLNKHWTFQDKENSGEVKKFSQFIFVSVIGMVVNVSVATLVATYARNLIDLNALTGSFAFISNIDTNKLWGSIGALTGTAVGLMWNFIGYKFWVFKK